MLQGLEVIQVTKKCFINSTFYCKHTALSSSCVCVFLLQLTTGSILSVLISHLLADFHKTEYLKMLEIK